MIKCALYRSPHKANVQGSEIDRKWSNLVGLYCTTLYITTNALGRLTTFDKCLCELVSSEISLRIAAIEYFYQVKRMIRRHGDVMSSAYSQTLNG